MPTTIVKSGGVTITARLPDLSARGMRAKWRRAAEDGLHEHRRAYQPRHFRAEAFALYAQEYNILRDWYESQREKARKRWAYGGYGSAGPGEGEKSHGIVHNGLRGNRNVARSRDPKNLRPLYQSGRTESTALQNPGTVSGTPQHLVLTVRGLPAHLNFVPNARRMLSAVAPDEAAATAKRIDANLSQEIDK